ncbi:Acyl-CoA dehydrogenase FadE27 [Mycolicibacterium vanbaalenii]|uniref:Acyl-CoA dehydrogenase FadE27 n=1 Tax=Mycolicibacterium vanbaalenii TaxID=110539 RepID=A0A5S9MPN7_MYCVN|nr:acyl-CoA dehydrogenase family protein [Mycolicibacterium vanbaalenii]CAA0078976.1 Acyl-CoA dehydrogenase FadE27 [Mycolicibacterium vanbaalenii]
MTPDATPSLTEIADNAAHLAELRDAADDILRHAWAVERTRALLDGTRPAFDGQLWRTICEVGWPDVLVDDADGGGGGSLRELCVLAEAAGAVALPVPLPATAAASWLQRRCTDGITLVLDDSDPRPTLSSAGLTGSWGSVPYGAVADRLLILADRDGEPVLGAVDPADPGVTRQAQQPLDHQPAAAIAIDGAAFEQLDAEPSAARRYREALFRVRIATVAELIGIAEAANRAAADYAKVRVTFGRPIGSRQAIKHRLVDQRGVIEVARALVNRSADACEQQHPETPALVSLTAFWAIDSLRRVPEGAVQVFGGIAYTWEHDAHVYLRRAATLAAHLGARHRHRETVAAWLQSR